MVNCSICGERIYFWHDWDDDENLKAHKKCIVSREEHLQAELKRLNKIKKKFNKTDEENKKIREDILKETENLPKLKDDSPRVDLSGGKK